VESNVGRLANAVLAAAFIALVSASAASAQSVESLVSAVVKINTHINPDGRTVQSLGHEREGSGVVIDSAGLVLTIGYLMVEAYAAEVVDNNGRTVPADVVGYDHESGFGLLRAIEPLKLKPMALGKSADGWSYLTYNSEDEHGTWTYEQLEEMNDRFVAALEQAFRSGQERRESAAAEIGGIKNGAAGLAQQRSRQLVEAARALPIR
jgi:Trypsin-like peptidase domain